MNYRQAMKQKCKCGRYVIGGWFGDRKTGKEFFTRVSVPVVTEIGLMMVEEHTYKACYHPARIE